MVWNNNRQVNSFIGSLYDDKPFTEQILISEEDWLRDMFLCIPYTEIALY